jgi:hypothetical protein
MGIVTSMLNCFKEKDSYLIKASREFPPQGQLLLDTGDVLFYEIHLTASEAKDIKTTVGLIAIEKNSGQVDIAF